MTEAITTEQNNNQAIIEFSCDQMESQVKKIQQMMKMLMTEDEHYGIIPGCKKKSLYKPGAEKLGFMFRLRPRFKIIEKISTDDFVAYMTQCELVHINTGEIWGDSIRTCSSKEKKYRYRSVTEKKATEEEKQIAVRSEIRHGQYGDYRVLIIPQDPRDVENTILAMSEKRAYVGAILCATAASDIFTQEFEGDVPPEGGSSGGQDFEGDVPPRTPQEGHNKPAKKTNPSPTIGDPGQKAKMHEMLTEMYGPKYGNELERVTAWTEKNMRGKKTLGALSDKQIPVIYGKIKSLYEKFKVNNAPKKTEYTPDDDVALCWSDGEYNPDTIFEIGDNDPETRIPKQDWEKIASIIGGFGLSIQDVLTKTGIKNESEIRYKHLPQINSVITDYSENA